MVGFGTGCVGLVDGNMTMVGDGVWVGTQVLWGRCVYDNICRFLQFQLTVNITAIVVRSCFCGRDTLGLSSLQLLEPAPEPQMHDWCI